MGQQASTHALVVLTIYMHVYLSVHLGRREIYTFFPAEQTDRQTHHVIAATLGWLCGSYEREMVAVKLSKHSLGT